jgi:hypothetical protein
MKKNLILILSSVILSILIIEIFLRTVGLYSDLTNINLEPSSSIYEKPKNSSQKHKHPDLDYINTNYFDSDGVKNQTQIATSQKKNIIGFFGDSFIENYAVNPNFEFSNILNLQLANYEAVNYGVGGYNTEQAFLRYLKYKNHDLKYVFYLFMPQDQETLGLITFNKIDQYIINSVKINPILSIVGKFQITYFILDAGLKIRTVIFQDLSDIENSNYPHILANRAARKNLNHKEQDMKNFAQLIEAFKKEVEKNQGKFIVILYPVSSHINYFEETLGLSKLKIDYFILDNKLSTDPKYQFKNDNHWNEYGNLEFQKNIKYYLNDSNEVNFVNNIDDLKITKEIEDFYNNYRIR